MEQYTAVHFCVAAGIHSVVIRLQEVCCRIGTANCGDQMKSYAIETKGEKKGIQFGTDPRAHSVQKHNCGKDCCALNTNSTAADAQLGKRIQKIRQAHGRVERTAKSPLCLQRSVLLRLRRSR